MSRPRRRAAALLGAGALAIVLARLAGGIGTPPLYDTFSIPDPYRYLHPSGGARGDPQSASSTLAYAGADVGAIEVATGPGENPPQATLIVAANSLSVPPGAHSITASITPVDTPGVAPPGDTVVVGNTYRFRIVTDAGADVGVLPGKQVTVVLRGPTGTAQATVEQFDGHAWTALDSNPVGGPDTWAANSTHLGDAALVAPRAHVGGGLPWLPWLAGGVAVVIVAGEATFLLLARRRRMRRRA